MGFYDSYLEMLQNQEDPEIPELKESGFRKKLLETQKHNVELVKLMATAVKHTLAKPQQLLHDDEDYYIGIDMYTNTYYVCYKNLLMIDIDYYKSDPTSEADIISKFKDYCEDRPDLRFKLYRSRNGIHGFLVSHEANHWDDYYLSMMLDLGADFYYTVYSYLRGWSVRLNKKKTDQSDQLYTYICDIGNGREINRLKKQVDLHINLVDVFKDTGVNTMFGN